VSGPLPQLLDVKALRAELGVSRAAAEAIMRQLPTVQLPGLRKVYVRRPDVARLLEESTSRRIGCRREARAPEERVHRPYRARAAL
jgi:hypothetical protein